jgi:cell division protease FtsH
MSEDKKENTGGIPKNYWRLFAAFSAALLFMYGWNIFFNPNAPAHTTINYSQFIEQLNAGNIKSVSIKKEQVTGEFIKEARVPLPGDTKPAQVKYFQTVLPSFQGEGLLTLLKEKNVSITIESAEQGALWQIVIGFLPWVLIIGFWVFMSKRNQQVQGGPGGLFTFGTSKAKLYDAKKPSVTFKDVAGMDQVKMELRETIEFLKDPSRFE